MSKIVLGKNIMFLFVDENERGDEVELVARQNAGDALAGRSETVDGGENESAVND